MLALAGIALLLAADRPPIVRRAAHGERITDEIFRRARENCFGIWPAALPFIDRKRADAQIPRPSSTAVGFGILSRTTERWVCNDAGACGNPVNIIATLGVNSGGAPKLADGDAFSSPPTTTRSPRVRRRR